MNLLRFGVAMTVIIWLLGAEVINAQEPCEPFRDGSETSISLDFGTKCVEEQNVELPKFPDHWSNDTSDDEVWLQLPTPTAGRDLPLPNWAKAVAGHLPKTAAALLQLDYAQRTKSPLDSKLRAKMRFEVAKVNRCEYAKRTALLDLLHAGATSDELLRLVSGVDAWLPDEQEPLSFAQKLSTDAARVPDAEFDKLVQRFGPRETAAMVLLVAYGNFQDRLLLGLGIEAEGSAPLPPLKIEFDPSVFQAQPILPPNRPFEPLLVGGIDVIQDDGAWGEISYAELQRRLVGQKERNQRLPVPTWDEVAPKLPPSFAARPTRIVWNLVCLGYVPELAVPWSLTTRTMWAEAPQDRVFEESLFWVQTRALQCNYCMGHCEMLLEVAGLSNEQVHARLKALASNDWSAFPAAEQRAFAYARQLTVNPWAVSLRDYEALERDLGEKEAMAIFFWLCRGLYMTRVSDGFQLQLETDNVFSDFALPPKSK